jgi:Skp family chaperone for outer membrane proteins
MEMMLLFGMIMVLIFLCGLLTGVAGTMVYVRFFSSTSSQGLVEKNAEIQAVCDEKTELNKELEERNEELTKSLKEMGLRTKELEDTLEVTQRMHRELQTDVRYQTQPRFRRTTRLHVTAHGECFHNGPCKSTQTASIKLYRPCHYCCDVLD